MSNTINRATVATATAAIVLALVGCSSAGGASLIPGPPKAAAATTTPTPTAIPGDTDGNGRLSEFEKQILAKNAARDYTMPDGSIVKIDPQQPLPEPVKAAIAEQAAPIAAQFTSTDISVAGPAVENMRSFAKTTAAELGKPLVIVWLAPSAIPGQPGASEMIWLNVPSGVRSTGLKGEHTKEAMVASAQQWGEPRGYEVIAVG